MSVASALVQLESSRATDIDEMEDFSNRPVTTIICTCTDPGHKRHQTKGKQPGGPERQVHWRTTTTSFSSHLHTDTEMNAYYSTKA